MVNLNTILKTVATLGVGQIVNYAYNQKDVCISAMEAYGNCAYRTVEKEAVLAEIAKGIFKMFDPGIFFVNDMTTDLTTPLYENYKITSYKTSEATGADCFELKVPNDYCIENLDYINNLRIIGMIGIGALAVLQYRRWRR